MSYNVLDLFSGAGGFSLGFELAGFNVIGSVEWDEHAALSHSKNFPNSIDIQGDIVAVTDEQIIENYADKGVNVIIAGPSCQSFSNANRSEDPYSEKAIERNKLFVQVLRFAKLLNPDYVVIENVPQILTANEGYAKNTIIQYLEDLGYHVDVKVLLASDYGVPENRRRAFFIASKKELFDFETLKKKEKVTVWDALSDIYDSEGDGDYLVDPKSEYQKYLRKDSTGIQNHKASKHGAEMVERMKYVGQGENWFMIPKHAYGNRNFSEKTHYSAHFRLKEDGQSNTIIGKLDNTHPIHHRHLTVREGARIQSFPDDFVFMGPKTKQTLQVGNAVPPLLAKAVAERIHEMIGDDSN